MPNAVLRKVRAARRGRLVRQWLPGTASSSDVGARLPRWLRGAVLGGVALVLVVVGVVRFGSSAPGVEAPPALPTAVSSAPSASAAATEPMVVSVVGKVRHVGLVRVPAGSRVADVIAKAGGALPRVNLLTINLARPVSDGEQIYVGIPVPASVQQPQPSGDSAGGSGTGATSGGNAGGAGKVDLNTASAEQLDQLPGVGEVTAKRIIDWRTQHGKFRSVADLQEVDGIGETRFSRLKDLVSAG